MHVVDPDAADRKLERQLEREERASHLGRYLSIAPDGAGGVRVKGRGSAEDGALLKAALMPLTAPAPAVDEHDGHDGELVRDPRDAGARMWDALVPDRAARLGHRPATRLPRRTRPTHGHHHPRGTARRAWPTTPSTSSPSPPSDGWRVTPRSSPPSSAARGEPFDVGRAKRLVTLAIWAALVIRDRHCAFPGCDRPPLMCHAHHILHWISGGETKLDNLVLLCGHHHRVIHHSPWEVRINPDDHNPNSCHRPNPASKDTGSDIDHDAHSQQADQVAGQRQSRSHGGSSPSLS